jgi:hypothetical protein
MIEMVVPLLKRSGVRAVFSGHEHNFQHSRSESIDYFITGAGGKVRAARPSEFSEAHTISWAGAGNFLIVDVAAGQMVVTPLGELSSTGNLEELVRVCPAGERVQTPIIISRA